MLRLALLFLILIVYGSLYPFIVWELPDTPLFGFLLEWPARLSGADLVQNVLAYAPFGVFIALWRLRAGTAAAAVGRALGAGFLLSLAMESLQQFEPSRTASLADIAMNVVGALAGALVALLFSAELADSVTRRGLPTGSAAGAAPGQRMLGRLHAWRARQFYSGTLANIGLAALALWALSQTSPLVPAFGFGYLSRNLGSLAWQLHHPLLCDPRAVLVRGGQLCALGLLSRTLLRPRPRGGAGSAVFIIFLACVFTAKLLVYGRYLALEDLIGAALALGVLQLCRHADADKMAMGGSAALLAAFILSELSSDGGGLYPFNWVPLSGQMRSLAGLENILELFWPFFALAYFVRLLAPVRRHPQVSVLGGLLVLALAFQLEWMQQQLPGRYGDITQVLLAVGGWLLPWSFNLSDDAARRAGVRRARGDTASDTPAAVQQEASD